MLTSSVMMLFNKENHFPSNFLHASRDYLRLETDFYFLSFLVA